MPNLRHQMRPHAISTLRHVSILCLVLLCSSCWIVEAQTGADTMYPGTTWTMHPNREANGWSTEKLNAMRAYADSVQSQAYMIIEGGYVVDTWGPTDQKEIVQSVRKSLLSGLYGRYVEDGTIDRHATLASLGIDDKNSLTDAERQATVQHLLQARSGVYHGAAASPPGMVRNLPERGSHAPGAYWYYNNWDFNALGTIFNQETGRDLYAAFNEDIAHVIGMEDFVLSDSRYMYEAVSEHPAYHFFMSARDMARFGLLFLRNGQWEDQQVIPVDWIEESTQTHSDAGVGGYGYMWWTGIPGVPRTMPSYAARGGNGHMILVVPEADLVFVHRVPMRGYHSPGWNEVVRLIAMMFEARGG